MWYGFDPSIQRDLAVIRAMVARQHQTPSHVWPVVYVEESRLILVVSAWPDGSLTAYCVENTDA
jgi:hypothetical protein